MNFVVSHEMHFSEQHSCMVVNTLCAWVCVGFSIHWYSMGERLEITCEPSVCTVYVCAAEKQDCEDSIHKSWQFRARLFINRSVVLHTTDPKPKRKSTVWGDMNMMLWYDTIRYDNLLTLHLGHETLYTYRVGTHFRINYSIELIVCVGKWTRTKNQKDSKKQKQQGKRERERERGANCNSIYITCIIQVILIAYIGSIELHTMPRYRCVIFFFIKNNFKSEWKTVTVWSGDKKNVSNSSVYL